MRSIVVTGLGAVTPLGTSVKDSWSNLCEGRSGIRPITQFDVSRLRTRVAGQVCDFEPKAYMDARLAGRVDRFIQLGVGAARQAVQDARLIIDGAGTGLVVRRQTVSIGHPSPDTPCDDYALACSTSSPTPPPGGSIPAS